MPPKTKNKQGLSLESAFDLLTTTMQDPWISKACAIRLSCASSRILEGYSSCTTVEQQTKIAKSHPAFLRAAIRFLTTKQPFEKFSRMLDRFTHCKCDLSLPGMSLEHPITQRFRPGSKFALDTTALIFDVATVAAKSLVLVLSDLTKNKFRRPDPSLPAERQAWPLTVDDLLPNGVGDSVDGLENWLLHNFDGCFEGIWVLRLAGSIAQFYEPFANTMFHRDPDYAFVHGRPLNILQAAIAWHKNGGKDCKSVQDWFRWFDCPVDIIINFFYTLNLCCRDEWRTLLVTAAESLGPVFSQLSTITASHGQGWENTKRHIQFFDLFTNAVIEARIEEGSADDFGVRLNNILSKKVAKRPEPPYGVQARDVFREMVQARKGGCSNITCPPPYETAHARLCSKCNVMRFCGDKCLREAWKLDLAPHKTFCASVGVIKTAFGPTDWERVWGKQFTESEFEALCTSKGVPEDTLKSLEYAFKATRICKARFRDSLSGDPERADWKDHAKKSIVGFQGNRAPPS